MSTNDKSQKYLIEKIVVCGINIKDLETNSQKSNDELLKYLNNYPIKILEEYKSINLQNSKWNYIENIANKLK